MKAKRRTDLGGGWWMEEPMTRLDATALYEGLDADEHAELAAVRCSRERFIEESVSADRSAAFFADGVLVFGISANWIPDPFGKAGAVRIWDTMSTIAVRERGLSRKFVEKTPLMREAFMDGEPTRKVIGVVKADFERSRKWIERCAGFAHKGDVVCYGVKHAVYEYDGEV